MTVMLQVNTYEISLELFRLKKSILNKDGRLIIIFGNETKAQVSLGLLECSFLLQVVAAGMRGALVF